MSRDQKARETVDLNKETVSCFHWEQTHHTLQWSYSGVERQTGGRAGAEQEWGGGESSLTHPTPSEEQHSIQRDSRLKGFVPHNSAGPWHGWTPLYALHCAGDRVQPGHCCTAALIMPLRNYHRMDTIRSIVHRFKAGEQIIKNCVDRASTRNRERCT